jgi:hypothetical protein
LSNKMLPVERKNDVYAHGRLSCKDIQTTCLSLNIKIQPFGSTSLLLMIARGDKGGARNPGRRGFSVFTPSNIHENRDYRSHIYTFVSPHPSLRLYSPGNMLESQYVYFEQIKNGPSQSCASESLFYWIIVDDLNSMYISCRIYCYVCCCLFP